MKTRFLFPHKYKLIGWMMLVPAAVLGILMMVSDYQTFQPKFLEINVFSLTTQTFGEDYSHWFKNNIADELTVIVFTIGALLAGFSREKNEDEYIASIRLDSLVWATYINYALLLIAIIFIYDLGFFHVMIYNMFTILIIFLLRFNFMLYKNNKTIANEK